LEWDHEVELEGGGKAKETDFDRGVAFLNWKVEHGMKTPGSEALVGLPDVLLAVLLDWRDHRRCGWVFPNAEGRPWVGGGPGYKHLDQLKALANRAGIEHATWKLFWPGTQESQLSANDFSPQTICHTHGSRDGATAGVGFSS
jgi:hypothetical protein